MPTDQPASPELQVTPFKFDYDAWIAEDAKRREAFSEQLVLAKTKLFDFLSAEGIVLVTIAFDGYGDSGQIEEIAAFDEHGEMVVPDDMLICSDPDPDIESDCIPDHPVKDVMESLAYDLLQSDHGGWENNDGAYGQFRFDVADRTIKLEYNERFTSSEYSETNW